MSFFEQHAELGHNDTRNRHRNAPHRKSKHHDTGGKEYQIFTHKHDLLAQDRTGEKAESLRTPKATHPLLYNKAQAHEQFQHRGRAPKGLTHPVFQAKSPSPTRPEELDYDSEDNLILKTADEYIGRRKKRTYANETFAKYNARMEANEARLKEERRRNGGPDADRRFEKDWFNEHTRREYFPNEHREYFPNQHTRREDFPRFRDTFSDADSSSSQPPYSHASPPSARRLYLYDILGCTPSSTLEEVTHNYRRKMFALHPDRNPNMSEEHKKLSNEVRRAGVVLRDHVFRSRYDRLGDNDQAWPNTKQSINSYIV